MTMRHVPHLLVGTRWDAPTIDLSPDQVHHLSRVLRVPTGAAVTYTDGSGTVGDGVFSGEVIERGDERRVEPLRPVTLAVAPPDSKDRVRFLVEKVAEIGVSRLRWLRTVHGQGRPPRSDRVRNWVVSALEQSRGAWLMDVDATPIRLGELAEPLLVADPGGPPLAGVEGPVTIAIGPEGGWAPDEIPESTRRVDLGATVLRVETAAVVSASLLLRG